MRQHKQALENALVAAVDQAARTDRNGVLSDTDAAAPVVEPQAERAPRQGRADAPPPAPTARGRVDELKAKGKPKTRKAYGVAVPETPDQPVMVFLTCRVPADLRDAVSTKCHQMRMTVQDFTALALQNLLEELADEE